MTGKNSSYYQIENEEFSQTSSKCNCNPKYDDCFFRQLYTELLSLDHCSSVSHQFWAKPSIFFYYTGSQYSIPTLNILT